jgi:head-tail adaptor
MRQRCSLQRRTLTSDGGGGQTETWAAHLTGLPCRAWAQTGGEVVIADRVVATEQWVVIVPVDTDVRTRDRIDSITNRLGATVLTGPVDIAVVAPRADHIELRLAVREAG